MDRLFFAINLSEKTKSRIKLIIDDFKKFNEPIKYENIAKIHITLIFLGDVEREKQLVLLNDTNNSNDFDSLDLIIKNTGVFPNIKMPKIIWLGLEHNETINKIVNKLKQTCTNAKINFDDKPFKAHLTLGRVKGNLSESFKNYLLNYKYSEMLESVNSFDLMKSILEPSGSKYFVVKKFNLKEKINV